MKRFKPFKSNPFPTVGVEQEFHLIDPQTGDLASAFPAVYKALDPSLMPAFSAELKECIIEAQTPPCRTIAELQDHVCKRRRQLAQACDSAGVRMVAAGTHPFAQWAQHPYIDNPHYQWVKTETGYVSDRMLAFGLHIHVGMQSMNSALYALHEFRKWVYPLLAMSANSPFYEGRDTGLDSTRMHLFGAMPRTCLPPDVLDVADYEYVYNRLLLAGDVTAPGDLWWIMRPQPPLGTLEIRVCDLPTDARRISVLAAIVQCALAYYQDRFAEGRPVSQFRQEFLEQNCWKAMRYGLAADMIDAETGDVVAVNAYLASLLERLGAKARELGCGEQLAAAYDLLETGNEASIQRRFCAETGQDFHALELHLADLTLAM
jgi:carboxylate-amine ligase